MKIKPIASGSSGNAYLIEGDNGGRLLIDCGIPFNRLMEALNFKLPDLCLVTHSHLDHSLAANDLRKYGVEVIDKFQNFKGFDSYDIHITPLEMAHDVPCFGFLFKEESTGESLFFCTDTAYIPYELPSVTYLMLECNHDTELLYKGELTAGEEAKNKRLIKTHMNIDSLLLWLSQADLTATKRIYLLHLSEGASNEQEFKKRVMTATGLPVTICQSIY